MTSSLQQQRYNQAFRSQFAEHIDGHHSLEDIIYIRNTPYIATVLKMVCEGYLPSEDFPFLLKPPSGYDVPDCQPPEQPNPESLSDFTPNRHRRLFLVLLGGISYTELHHIRSLSKLIRQELIVVSTSLSNPQDFIKTLSEIDA